MTDDLDLTGTNTLTYEGSIGGGPPDNYGSIWLSSHLVFYR